MVYFDRVIDYEKRTEETLQSIDVFNYLGNLSFSSIINPYAK